MQFSMVRDALVEFFTVLSALLGEKEILLPVPVSFELNLQNKPEMIVFNSLINMTKLAFVAAYGWRASFFHP